MAKSLFDPAKAVGAESANAPAAVDARPMTVSQATELIKHALERHTPGSLRVVGQVSNLSARDHWYFSLKDDKAVLACVAWATAVRKLAFQPRDGDEIVVTGHLSHYGPQGKTQLYVNSIAPVGAGALALKFRALCDELRSLGYFDESRKRALPVFPRRVAVITSSGGAAVHDVINTAAQRCKAVAILVVDVKVQGEGAAEDVARAIAWVDAKRDRLGVDAILVTRGGGSIEDLWAFNERVVADAIYASHLPVVAAIGHESDTTIAELVADVRASTPTQAAVRLVPAATELFRHLAHISQRNHMFVARALERRREHLTRSFVDVRQATASRIASGQVQLQRAMTKLARIQPEAVLTQRESRLRVVVNRLRAAMLAKSSVRSALITAQRDLHLCMGRRITHLRNRATSAERQLAAVDPHGVLRRGYSITTRARGGVVRSRLEVRDGEVISTHVSDGSFDSVVSNARSNASRGRMKPGREDHANQFDLFG